jgi:Rrf2 family protein
MRIPEHFLTKIVQQLARMGIIAIEQGPKGGCQLLKTPKELSLLDVVEALMGEIFLNDCVMSPSSCFRNPSCAVHRVWCKAREQLRDSLRTATFDKLLEEESCLMPGHADEKVKEVLGRDSLGPNG